MAKQKYSKDEKQAYLQVLVMPNGEILCEGKQVGMVKKIGKYLVSQEKVAYANVCQTCKTPLSVDCPSCQKDWES